MSELVSSLLTASMPMQPEQASPEQLTGLLDSVEVTDFASVFADLNVVPALSKDPLLESSPDEIASAEPSLLLPHSMRDNELIQTPGNIPLLETANLSIDGNPLPLNLSMLAISDFSTQIVLGDGKTMLASGAQYTNTTGQAMQPLAIQLPDMMQATSLQQEMQTLAMSKTDMGKSIDALASQQQQQISPLANDLVSSLNGPLLNQTMSGLQGVTEFSNVLAATNRTPESMTATLNQPQWSNQVGDRIAWMISQGLRQADIRLNPPELGMLEVRIQMQGDQTSIQFTTAHAEVKDVLDSALPRLREMLAETGLNLADVNVSQQGQHQTKNGDDSNASQTNNEPTSDAEMSRENQDINSFKSNGIIDLYA